MNIIEEWVEALESGKYEQGRSRLKIDETTYCCLGVLCEISGMGTWKINSVTEVADYLGGLSMLPPEVRKQARLFTSMGGFTATDDWYMALSDRARQKIRNAVEAHNIPGRMSLSWLNDSGVPFDVIAEVIKSRPPGLLME